MSLHEVEDNNPFPSGIDDPDVFTEFPIEDESVAKKTSQEIPSDVVVPNGKESISSVSYNNGAVTRAPFKRLYSQRIEDVLVKNHSGKQNTKITIIEATKSKENEHATTSRSYIIYTIKIADDIIVKRRYSEFENLRNILIKLFPLMIVPPIPEKTSITSNLSLSSVPTSALKSATLSSTSASSSSSSPSESNLDGQIAYRRRALKSFLERCIAIDAIRENFVFLTFLDPHPNFNEFIHSDEIGILSATSIYRLSPHDALGSLGSELYQTLPIPPEHLPLAVKDESNKKQLAEYTVFESRFKEYESILSNIIKYNRGIIKNMAELSTDYAEIGSYYNSLSLHEESASQIIEKLGHSFDTTFFDMNALKNLINLKFLESVIELKNFIKVVRHMIIYNKKKWLQAMEVARLIEHYQASLEKLEEVSDQTKIIDDALSKSRVLNPKASKSKPPVQVQESSAEDNKNNNDEEAELRSTLSKLPGDVQAAATSNTLFGYKIPGLKRVNKAILSITDQHPEQTRKAMLLKTKLTIIQLKKQQELIIKDNELIDRAIPAELKDFQTRFKLELNRLCYEYSKDMNDFVKKGNESWEEISSNNCGATA